MNTKTETVVSEWLKEKPKNIIVRMPNWLGDLVMATPILKDLRTNYPDAEITAMCQTNVCSLLTHDPNINEIFCYQRPSGWIHRRKHFEIIEPLRRGGYDLGILLTNSFSSAWWFWRGRVQNRLGFSNGIRNLFLDKAVPFPPEKESQHLVITYKSLLKPLGIAISDTPTLLFSSAFSAKYSDARIAYLHDLLNIYIVQFISIIKSASNIYTRS